MCLELATPGFRHAASRCRAALRLQHRTQALAGSDDTRAVRLAVGQRERNTIYDGQVYFDTSEAIVRVCKEAGWPVPSALHHVRQV